MGNKFFYLLSLFIICLIQKTWCFHDQLTNSTFPDSSLKDYRNNSEKIKKYWEENNYRTINKTTSGTGVWTEVNPLLPRVDYIGVHFVNTDTGWAVGTGGTIIKTINGGEDWTISTVTTNNILLKISSFNGNIVIAGGYDGLVFRSSDGGENFAQVASGLGSGQDLWGLQMINDTLSWACGMNNSLIKTTNAGLNWQIVSTGLNTNYWWLDFLNTQVGFIACDGGKVLKTTNGGISWQQYQAGNTWSLYTIDAIDSLHIVAAGANGKNVYSDDGGINWVENYRLIFDEVNCVDFIDKDTGYAIGVDWGIRKTTDRGQTWFASNINVGEWHLQLLEDYPVAYCVGNSLKLNKANGTYDNWHKLVLNDDFNNIFFVNEEEGWVTGNGLYKTTNGGLDWVFQENFPYGLSKYIDELYFFNPDTGIIGKSVDGIKLFKTTNNGQSWDRKYITGLVDSSGEISKFFFINSQIGWAVTVRGAIIKTTDGGDSWFAQLNAGASVIFRSLHFVDSLYGWTANSNKRPFKTTDGGNTWVEQTNLSFWHTHDVYFTCPDSGWIINEYTSTILYRTSNGGLSWMEVPEILGAVKFYFFPDPIHWMIYGANKYMTNDGGNSWIDITGEVPYSFNSFKAPTNKLGFACGGTGLILRYDDTTYVPVELISFSAQKAGGSIIITWTTASEMNNFGFEIERKTVNTDWLSIGFIKGGGTTTEFSNYSFVDSIVTPGVNYYRLKQVDYNGTYKYYGPISINTGEVNNYNVYQNYPNPFNSLTKIRFLLPTESYVKIMMYNALGELTEILLNETKGGGYHEIIWNAKDYTSGVYLLVFEALTDKNLISYRSTKKLLLIK
jgi:photosystem II stability/assembly factor-like uncharacterized protein